MGPTEYAPDNLTSTRVESPSRPLCDTPRPAEEAASDGAPDGHGASPSAATNSPRTFDCPSCANLRTQNTALCDLLVQESDALHAVGDFAREMSSRAGSQIDAATVSARLWPILAGIPLPVRPCQRCVDRAVTLRREADSLLGLADLQRAPL